MKRLVVFTLFFFLNCSFNSGAAQELTIERGLVLLRHGAYKEAITLFTALVEKDGKNRDAQEGLIRAQLEIGDYATAERRVREFLSAQPSDGGLRSLAGEVNLEVGRYAEAAAEFERAARDSKGATWLRAVHGRARALGAQGKEDEARAAVQEFVRYYNDNAPRSAEELTILARGMHLLEKFKDANELFIDAREADPNYIDAFVGQGELLNEKYNYGDAASLFTDALRLNASHAAAFVGLAESKRLESATEPYALVSKALEINPNNARALVFRAWLELEAEKREDALASVEKALSINPNMVEAMAVRGSVYYLAGRKAELAAEIKRALAVNPRAGQFFESLAHFATNNRRYADAVDFGRAAVELSPRLWSARTELGIQLLRVGRMAEGRAELERTFNGDPFNIWAKNTLDLLDSMKDYQETIRGPFLIKSAPKETGALAVYAADLLEDAHKRLTAKYKFTPKGPISVELFPNHEDFAVRSLGLPGLGALGVCFGQVIAMDSPSARAAGQFNWGGTLWHEYMHVISLQMTDYKIPRWFSEGLSVYEERRGRQGWGDNWSLETLKAYTGGRFVGIEDLDAAFTRPKTPDGVTLAYFQASQVCEFVEERFGFDALLKMLAFYKEGASTVDVLKRTFSMSPGEFDRAFNDYLKSKTSAYAEAVAGGPAQTEGGQPASKDALAALVKARPKDYFAHLRLGTIYKRDGDADKAIEHLSRAVELFPYYGREGNPYKQLAEIHESRGHKREAASALEALTRYNETDLEAFKKLAGLRMELGDKAGALDVLFTTFYIYPFDAGLHKLAGDVYLELGKPGEAVREYRVVVALEPNDPAQAHYDLARSLEAAGNRAEARREVLRSLEIAPGFEKAQELLLKLRGGS